MKVPEGENIMIPIERENSNVNSGMKIEMVATIMAIIGIFLPFSSTRIVAEWSDSLWMHTTVIEFLNMLFTAENITISNINIWVWIRNISYLMAIILLFIHLIRSIRTRKELENSKLWIIVLACLAVVVLAHIIINLSTSLELQDMQIQRRLSFGFYMTLIGTLVPVVLKYVLARNTTIGSGLSKISPEFSNIKNVTLIKRLVVGNQEFQPERRDVNLGFSWFTFLFSPFIDSLIKKEWTQAGIWFFVLTVLGTIQGVLIVGISSLEIELLLATTSTQRERITSQIASTSLWFVLLLLAFWSICLFLAFGANKRYAKRLIQANWEPAQVGDAKILEAYGIIGADKIAETKKVEEENKAVKKNLIAPTMNTATNQNTQNNSLADELIKLKELLDQEAISEEEFVEFKKQLLNK